MSPTQGTIVPRVGVAVFVTNKEGKFILGKRKGSHGAGTWGLPGGHLEANESFEDCAQREILEETGLAICSPRFLTATNDVMEAEGKHYVTIFMGAQLREESAQPEILEVNKCDAWEWASWEAMRADGETQMRADKDFEGRKLFLPLLSLLQQRPDFRV
ncbi:uncharacterized protein N7459_004000 [Penicillium hispanicum]|uniref:uncharacterized protein n=1 Tax=Penicillium hispanicum TaxID=1080232 RepID=UPI002540C3DC|nr:uncharacterized protein N7459_004000 [Penicillium hispanicum]KAJ5584200.1 hypothetical protein N7459_004000 [Penicillium hispanicum]